MDTKENRQRNIQKKFYVDDLENQIIEKIMQKANLMNFGEFARKSCLDKKIYTFDVSELKEIASSISQANWEISRIGNNINQIAKYLNVPEQQETQELLDDYKNELKGLSKEFKKTLKKIVKG